MTIPHYALVWYDMDMGCSLKGSTASLKAYWDSFHIYIIYDFSKLSQIWGYVCGGNGMNVLPYAHPHPQLLFRHHRSKRRTLIGR